MKSMFLTTLLTVVINIIITLVMDLADFYTWAGIYVLVFIFQGIMNSLFFKFLIKQIISLKQIIYIIILSILFLVQEHIPILSNLLLDIYLRI